MRNELAFNKMTQALDVMSTLVENDYVCMLSLEEDLFIVNYEWSPNCDRNNVVFMTREDYDCEVDEIIKEAQEFWEDPPMDEVVSPTYD